VPTDDESPGANMSNDNRVVGYIGDSTHRSLSARADAADMSQSEWVREAIEEKLDREGLDDAARRFEVEDRLFELVERLADEAADQIAADLRDGFDLDDRDEGDEDESEYAGWGEE
jgi:hypothetical protein